MSTSTESSIFKNLVKLEHQRLVANRKPIATINGRSLYPCSISELRSTAYINVKMQYPNRFKKF